MLICSGFSHLNKLEYLHVQATRSRTLQHSAMLIVFDDFCNTVPYTVLQTRLLDKIRNQTTPNM